MLGGRIARLRAQRKFSLRKLAEKSGVSSSMLCDIENGAKSPTIALLSAIAEALGVRLSDLVAEAEPASGRIAIRRKNASPKLVDALGIERRQLAPEIPGGRCEIIQMAIRAHSGTGILSPHSAGSTEYVHVAQGSLEVRIGKRAYKLKAGDCIGFEADVRHEYTNTGSSRALLYVVIERKG